MEIPLYLAMTGAEFAACTHYPPHLAWMACHFSSYGTGLSNLPKQLPPHSILILNDRTPVCGHDPNLIYDILAECISQLRCAAVLLDFQRADCDQLAGIIEKLLTLPCPVAVSDIYAKDLHCPVFLSAPPLHRPLKDYLQSWEGREIWLEAAMNSSRITVTEKGSNVSAHPAGTGCGVFHDAALHCHYGITVSEAAVHFSLCRWKEDLNALLLEAKTLGVTHAVGLYQELGMSGSICRKDS